MTPPGNQRPRRPLWIPIIVFVVALALGGAELRLPVTSPQSGDSQVFFAGFDDSISEARSAHSYIHGGHDDLRFRLPFATRWVAWDPLNGPGEFAVDRAAIEALLWSIRLEAPRFSARYQIQTISRAGTAIVVTTSPEASDPRVAIQLPWLRIMLAQLGIAAALALLAGLLTLAGSRPQARALARNAAASSIAWARGQLRTFEAVPRLSLIAGVFWFLSLGSYLISVDDELAMLRVDQGVWVAQGRWATYLLTRFVLPQPVVPFMVHGLFCVLGSAAYVLLLRAHGLACDKRAVALFPVFVAFPVWFFIGEFYGNFFSAAVGLFLTALGAVVFHGSVVREPRASGWRPFLVATGLEALVVGTAMGAYQSFLLAFATVGVGVVLFAATRLPQFSARRVLEQLAALALSLGGSAAFYAAVSKLFRWALGQDVHYVDSFLRPALLLEHPWTVLESTVGEAVGFYTGSAGVYGVGFSAVGALMLLGTLAIARSVQGARAIVSVLVVAAACVALPFALNLVAGGAATIPYRALVGVPYVVWLFAACALHERRVVPSALALVALGVAAFQLVFLHASYIASVQLSLEHDKALAAQIHRRVVEKFPDFDRNKPHPVDLHGSKPFARGAQVSVPTSTIGRSYFDWDGGNADRIVIFMRILGYDGLALPSEAQRRSLLGEYKDMPLWPAEASVRRVGDFVLIKLGETPGSTHQF